MEGTFPPLANLTFKKTQTTYACFIMCQQIIISNLKNSHNTRVPEKLKTTEHLILLNIQIFWYKTLCHQVSTFPKIVQLSSSGTGSPNVPLVTKLHPMKRHSSPPMYQELRTECHSPTAQQTGSFIPAGLLTSNLASHLAFHYATIII
jgi:hypothetical protein